MVFAYLTIWYNPDSGSSGKFQYPSTVSHKRSLARADFLDALHDILEYVINPLSLIALKGIRMKRTDGEQVMFNLLLACYSSNFLETKDALRARRCNKIYFSCHNFLVYKGDMLLFTSTICFCWRARYQGSSVTRFKCLIHWKMRLIMANKLFTHCLFFHSVLCFRRFQ